MKFVWIAVRNVGLQPVNPAAVCYVRVNSRGDCSLVFGGMTGGLHELDVAGTVHHVVNALENGLDPAPPPEPVAIALQRPKQRAPRAGVL